MDREKQKKFIYPYLERDLIWLFLQNKSGSVWIRRTGDFLR